MNKEIEEAILTLDTLIDCTKEDGTYYTAEKEWEALEVFKKLAKENEKLNHYKLLYQKVKERNMEAIEYIDENRDYQDILYGRSRDSKGEMFTEDILREKNIEELLEILKGNNEE